MTSPGSPQVNDTSFNGIFNAGGRADQSSGQTIDNLLSALFYALAAFVVQFLVFLIIKQKFFRI